LKPEITQKVESLPSPQKRKEGLLKQTYLPGNNRHRTTPTASVGISLSIAACGLLVSQATDPVTAVQTALPISVPTSDVVGSDSPTAPSTVATSGNPYVQNLIASRADVGEAPTQTRPSSQSVRISVPTPKTSQTPVRYGQRRVADRGYFSNYGANDSPYGNVNEERMPTNTAPSIGFNWPAQGRLTSLYGRRWGRMHKGIDIAGPVGTPIHAAADGQVIFAGWSSGGYGYLVEIRHLDGSTTRYGHNSRNLTTVGQMVRQGQLIAEMGSTGRSTGSHVHFEIRPNGTGAVNPIAYLPTRTAYSGY
jgi:murein DD-endopeptidase MepM/ murein hydrolase activator NlpD